MKSFSLKLNGKFLDFLNDFCRELFMDTALRFMAVVLICLTGLNSCAPKASAREGSGKVWSSQDSDSAPLSIKVYPIEEWSNSELKVFRVDFQNRSKEELDYTTPSLKIEGRVEQPSRVKGREVNQTISDLREFRTRGAWEPRRPTDSPSIFPAREILGGNKTVNALWGLSALVSTAHYIAEEKYRYPIESNKESQTISPIKDAEWNSAKPLVLAASDTQSRWYALRLVTVQDIPAFNLEMLDGKGQLLTIRASFEERK
jgi:hypothetical protein